MKNKEVISGIVGAGFFALGYLGLSVAIIPSLAIGTGAYVASELLLSGKKKEEIDNKKLSLNKKIENAKKSNKHINEMIKEIEDADVANCIKEINVTTSKIIRTIEKNNINNKTSNKFLDYYLPVCVNIIDRYDEIENQKLTSKDSKKLVFDLDDECGFLDLGVFAFIFLSCNLFILPLNYKADRQILED